MAEEILKGYVVSRINFSVFDEIVVFLTENDEKIACISLGSRKIKSKNSRNLFLGNYVEFEIFKSRAKDKLSKLKKVTTLRYNEWETQKSLPFLVLSEIVAKTGQLNGCFDFYDKCLAIVKTKGEDEIHIINLLKETCVFLGLNISVNGCVLCGSKILKTFTPKEHGFLCPECVNDRNIVVIDPMVSKSIFSIFNDKKIDKNLDFFVKKNVIHILSKYVDENSGIFIKTLESY